MRKIVELLRFYEVHEVVKIAGTAGTFVALIMLILTIRAEIPRLRTEVIPGTVEQLVAATHREGDDTRRLVKDMALELAAHVEQHADHIQDKTDALAAKIEVDLMATVSSGIGKLDDRVRDGVAVANDQLGQVNRSVAGLALPLGDSIKRVDDGILIPLTDCENNPSCFDNRWRGISWDVESFLRTTSEATPRMAAALQKNADNSAKLLEQGAGIASDVHAVTDRFVHPPKQHWWVKLHQDLLTAGRIFAAVF